MSEVLLAASRRWGSVTGRDRLPVSVKLDGAKLHPDDLVGTFLADRDELRIAFSDSAATSSSSSSVASSVSSSVPPPDVDELEKALSIFFDENLFEGGRAKTVAELDEFQGLPTSSSSFQDDEEDDEEDDDDKAVALAVAMYNFLPEEPDEIGFVVGDKMIVYRKREDGWWRGRHLDGPNKLSGYFPGNRVNVIAEGPGFLKKEGDDKKKDEVEEAPKKRETVIVTMETESVVVHTAPGHGSPEMLRAVLEKEEVKVTISKVFFFKTVCFFFSRFC